jgi:Rod binding domain-containing protein
MQAGFDSKLATTLASSQAARLNLTAEGLAKDAKAGGPEAKNVPNEFSKLLATMLVKEMRQALPEGFFGEGAGTDVFEGWLDEHIGKTLAERDGLRIEGLIEASMRLKVEAAKGPSQDAPAAEPQLGVRP